MCPKVRENSVFFGVLCRVSKKVMTREKKVKRLMPCLITCLLVGMISFLPVSVSFAAPECENTVVSTTDSAFVVTNSISSSNKSGTNQSELNAADPAVSNPGAEEEEEAEVDMEQIKMVRYRKSVLVLCGFAALILAIVGIKLFYDMVILPKLDDVQPKKKKKKAKPEARDGDEEEEESASDGEFQYESIDDYDPEAEALADLEDEEPLEFNEEYVGSKSGKKGGK